MPAVVASFRRLPAPRTAEYGECGLGALTVLGWILMSAWTDSLGYPSTAATPYIIDLRLASVIVAAAVNRDYLEWRATVAPPWRTGPRTNHRRPPLR